MARVSPVINHALVFNTDETSYHGYPEPITPPPEVTRKSVALYYYTLDAAHAGAPRSTNYRARPGDGWRRVGIWMDNKALAAYSWVKRTFGISDGFASKVLGFLSRKKK